MKKKQIPVALCVAMLVLSLLVPASASELCSSVIDLGDGFYVVRTVTPCTVGRSGDIVYGQVTDYVYYQGTQIGNATLSAAFDISGSTVVATIVVLQGNGINGWSYTNGGTSCSGNKASGIATFESGTTSKQFVLSITCAPDGSVV